MSLQQLDSRLTPEIDFTCRDEITFSLLDAISCPIRLERTDDLIIFNHQYYNQVCFDRHERADTSHNHSHGTDRFKDPRTGYDVDMQTAIRIKYICRPTRANLVELVNNCIPAIRTEKTMTLFPMKTTDRLIL